MSYFCHFLRSSKFTHFHKNTKNTYFHYFPIRWRFCDFHLFSPFPQNTQKSPKWENWPKWGFPGKWPKPGKWGKWGKWADPQNTPKMAKMPKMGKLGILPIYPQNGYSATATDEHTPQAWCENFFGNNSWGVILHTSIEGVYFWLFVSHWFSVYFISGKKDQNGRKWKEVEEKCSGCPNWRSFCKILSWYWKWSLSWL